MLVGAPLLVGPSVPLLTAVLAIRVGQLHASSQEQSAALAAQVRHQLRRLTARLRRCGAAFVALARLVDWTAPGR